MDKARSAIEAEKYIAIQAIADAEAEAMGDTELAVTAASSASGIQVTTPSNAGVATRRVRGSWRKGAAGSKRGRTTAARDSDDEDEAGQPQEDDEETERERAEAMEAEAALAAAGASNSVGASDL